MINERYVRNPLVQYVTERFDKVFVGPFIDSKGIDILPDACRKLDVDIVMMSLTSHLMRHHLGA